MSTQVAIRVDGMSGDRGDRAADQVGSSLRRSAGSAPAIEVVSVSKAYPGVRALDSVSFTVSEGEILALLGPNGAGKTTIVGILTTLLALDDGRASVDGHDVMREPGGVRASIGLAGQAAAVDEVLSGRENLELVGRLYHVPRAEAHRRAGELLDRFDLGQAADRLVRTYSGGMRRRLDLAASLVATPRILFLDEPTTGLDPRGRIALWEVVEQLSKEGTTVVLTTQYLEEAERLADRIVVIDAGRVIAEGTPGTLKAGLEGDVLEVVVPSLEALEAVRGVFGRLKIEPMRPGDGPGVMRASVAGSGSQVAVDVVRQLDAAGIEMSGLSLHGPTLDDVFLALTGRPVDVDEDTEGGNGPVRQSGKGMRGRATS